MWGCGILDILFRPPTPTPALDTLLLLSIVYVMSTVDVEAVRAYLRNAPRRVENPSSRTPNRPTDLNAADNVERHLNEDRHEV